MKKLMTLIGAVAMAFGLFAATSTTYSMSFETSEDGISGTAPDVIFTPGNVTDWTFTSGNDTTLPVVQYATGETLPYGEGAFARRTVFPSYPDNDNYLKLEMTKSELLTRKVGTDNIFLDQLVQFSGFEEPQTNLVDGAKIAVWMGEFVTNETDNVELTETNLYVTCAKVTNTGVEEVVVKINGNYEIGKWYRLTIKSLGGIYGSGSTDSQRAGFIIYIDGRQVASEDAKEIVYYLDEMIPAAQKYMAAGQLFPAIDTTDTIFTTVSYNGIGAIDDIILDKDGPEFAQMVDVTADQLYIEGAKVVSITQGGEMVPGTDSWSVKPGDIVVTYAADGAYILSGTPTATWTVSTTADPEQGETNFTAEEAAAQVVNVETPAVTNYFAATNLYAMISSLVDGDVATFLAESTTIVDGEENTLYDGISAGTTITVTIANDVTTWVVAIADEFAWVTDNVGTTDDFNKVYTFADTDSTLALGGNVAGELTAANVSLGDAIEVSGTLTAEVLDAGMGITLVESGKVITKTDPLDLTDMIVDGDGSAVTPSEQDEDGWYTYQIQIPGTFEVTVELDAANVEIVSIEVDGVPAEEPYQPSYDVAESITVTYAPAEGYKWVDDGEDGEVTRTDAGTITAPDVVKEAESGFAIIIAGDDETTTNYYPTLDAAIAAAGTDDLPAVVTILENATLDATVTIAKSVAINLNGKTLTFGDGLKNGIVTTEAAQNLVISNGTFAVAGTRAAGGLAFQLYRVNALIKDVTMDTTGFEYGLEAETMLDTMSENWTEDPVYTITCENVDVTGNGSLFHFENVRASLDEDCSATAAGTSFGGAHEAAIYSSCGSIVTINGGTYTAPNALQTGNLGGDIVVVDGEFNGDIKSYMYEGDDRWAENTASIEIVGGTFNGDFAYGTGPAGQACTKDEVTWNITGGSFAVDPTDYLAEGYKAVEGDDVWTVVAKEFYDITFTVDGQADYVTNVVEGTEVATVAPADPVVEGKTFTAWAPALEGVVESNATYTAQFDDVMVKAIWIVDGVATTNEVVYNTVPEKPADPEKANYTFTGWDKDTTVAIKVDTEYTAQFEAITYKYTFAKGGAAGDATVADITYTVETAATLTAPAAGADWTVADSEFAGWTNTVDGGEIILTGAELVKALKDIELTAVWVATAPDFPVDPDVEITEKGQENIATAKTVFGDGLAAYVTKVYGDGGKIPASKLNGTSEDLIKIAKEYELPIMVAPTIAITQAAEGTGFEFQILDETVPVVLQAEKVLSMVEFTDDLGTTAFATATAANVTVAIKAESDSKTATADFTKATAAGFMRVNLKVRTTMDMGGGIGGQPGAPIYGN